LKLIPWLPVKQENNHWYKPNDVYDNNSEFLFASQGKFIDLNYFLKVELRDFLNVRYRPSTKQIVDHLLYCSRSNDAINDQIYRVLSSRWEEEKKSGARAGFFEDTESEINRLKGTPFIRLEEKYVTADSVFWNPTIFGRYAQQLGPQLNAFRSLFEFLGVATNPKVDTVLNIIDLINTEFGTSNIRLDNHALIVLSNCWKFLQGSLEEKTVRPEELLAHFNTKKIIAGSDNVLRRPSEFVFDDHPGLAAIFGDVLKKNLLPRSVDTWKALSAVGVGLLSQSIRTNINRTDNECYNALLVDRVTTRHFLFKRLMDAQRGGDWNLGILSEIKFYSVTKLVVVREVFVGGGVMDVKVDEPTTYYDTKTSVLYYCGSKIPWTDIARELLFALQSGAEMSSTFAIRYIIQPATFEEASLELDAAGIPKLEHEASIAVPEVYIATAGIVHNAAIEADVSPDDTNASVEEPKQIDELNASRVANVNEVVNENREKVESKGIPTAKEYSGELTGEALSSQKSSNFVSEKTNDNCLEVTPKETLAKGESNISGAMPYNDIAEDKESISHVRSINFDGRMNTNRKDTGSSFQPTPSRQRGRLYSYTVPENQERSSDTERPGLREHRDETEKAGIAAVLDYERKHGRFPQEMPENNPGFDIASYSSNEDNAPIERYIEVKSIPQQWGEKGVGLTRTQFQKANESGKAFWLYVVEQVLEGTPTVHPIQDPAGRVDQFFFDEGWRSAAIEEENNIADSS
jgi:hypothetical protein